jgi:hypothetical protein
MEQRKWTAPASPPDQAAVAPSQSRRFQWGLLEYAAWLFYYMLFFGLIAALAGSRFPIELGLFFFFTNDELIAWTLRKVGIRLVPESLGATFIGAVMWMTGVSILLTRWQDFGPAWLASIVLPNPSWPVIAGVALGCTVLAAVATTVVRRLLPWTWISIVPGGVAAEIIRTLIVFGILGLLALLGLNMATE